jgi:hypothetical protein
LCDDVSFRIAFLPGSGLFCSVKQQQIFIATTKRKKKAHCLWPGVAAGTPYGTCLTMTTIP